MSWSRRTLLGSVLGLAALPMSACFRPMLAADGPAAQLRGRIAFPEISGRFGYFLVRSLEDRLGKPSEPRWRLDVLTGLEETGLGIAQDNSVTRITVEARADWALFEPGGDVPVLSDTAWSQSGYNSTTSLFATRQTRRDIERRLARDLGERISRKIMAQADLLTR